MKSLLRALLAFIFVFSLSIATALADIIAQFNFNSIVPDSSIATGTNIPSVGSGTASLVGGVTATYSTGSTNDPASSTDDSGWATTDYPPQFTGDRTAGVQFNVSTVGYSNIIVRWDQRVTSTGSKYYLFQWCTDGNTFFNSQTPTIMQAAPSTSSYYEAQTNNLSATFGVNNNQNFAFRIVSQFEYSAIGSGAQGYVTVSNSTYNPGVNVRFDYVTVLGTLIPGGNTPPTISGISNQTIRVTQSTGPLSFTVLDAEDPAASLTLSRVSSNPSVVATTDITFGGSGASRSVNVTAGNQPGSSTITVWVSDLGGKSNSTSFVVTVLPANTAPVISAIAPTNTLVNTATAPIAFTVGDAESPAANLTLSGASANTTLVPNANIAFGGSGSNRTVTVTPASGQAGVAPITVTVSDGTNSASSVFGLCVRPSPSVLLYDPFSYPDGPLITNSGSLWANRSGTDGDCVTTNGQLQVSADRSEDVVANLAGAPYSTGHGTVLYSSFKTKILTLPNSNPDYFAHFGSGSTLRGRIYPYIPVGASFGTLRFMIGNATNSTDLPVDLTTNVTYPLVTRYNIDTATATLWLNPTSESSGGVTATDSQTPATISAYGFRQSSGFDSTILVDDLKVGLTFASVTTGEPAVFPIPLAFQRSGQKIILTWADPSFALQYSPSPNGPYTNIPTALSPYTNPISSSAAFFRLKH